MINFLDSRMIVFCFKKLQDVKSTSQEMMSEMIIIGFGSLTIFET
jgi:hypothetical protein